MLIVRTGMLFVFFEECQLHSIQYNQMITSKKTDEPLGYNLAEPRGRGEGHPAPVSCGKLAATARAIHFAKQPRRLVTDPK